MRKFLKASLDLIHSLWCVLQGTCGNIGISLLFFFLISIYLFIKIGEAPAKWPVPQFVKSTGTKIAAVFRRLFQWVSRDSGDSLSRLQLIDLAIHNMFFKRSRAIVTVGGMSIGVGSVVFLVSLGFGLERVVTSRAARLEELQQAEVAPQPGSNQRLTDQTLAQIKDLPNVSQTFPVIASVARISYENSITDVPVYAVTAGYLAQSAVQPIQGNLFVSEEVSLQLEDSDAGDVAGVFTEVIEFNAEIEAVNISTTPGTWVKIRSIPSRSGNLVGYTTLSPESVSAITVWGDDYPDNQFGSSGRTENGDTLGVWIKGSYPLWVKESCSGSNDVCVDGYRMVVNNQGQQEKVEGFIAQVNINAQAKSGGRVLGVTTETNEPSNMWLNQPEVLGITDDASQSATLPPGLILTEDNEWVEVASSSATSANTQTVSLGQGAHKVAVVNTALLKVLNIPVESAIGKTFSSQFVIPGELLEDTDSKLESVPAEYTIVGVIPGDESAFFYVPFIDLRSLGITAYSQAKVVSNAKQDLEQIRRQVESLGFVTNSVADTVKQIERLFSSFRIVLISLGLVALSVAALGMFNTLTVSLLERTREVGLMKAMGMKSSEVKELFLIESLVMGFFGGIGGILLGVLVGKGLSVVLSLISVSRQVGPLDITYVPILFIVFTFGLSSLVGMTTGIFPARRATKISALDALRYE